ncbi:MAG: sulfide-dependent adenosine diphosphate thiazole synthase [Planctomycetota bacterium]|nr:sulfide-dependent adenosine diphosphate thiazole synthase [Planctomycetota bacterium]
MVELKDVQISEAIVGAYYAKLTDRLVSDVLIVGAGPSGLVAAATLAGQGLKVTVLERRLSPGGGIWGGGIGMNEVVIQDQAIPAVDDIGVRHREKTPGLHTVDSVELACGLCLNAVRSGAVILNLLTVEDVCIDRERVTGAVVNRTGISGVLHVDPIMFSSRAMIDSTGHEAVVVETIRKRGLLRSTPADGQVEGPMNPASGEAFVVDRVAEVYPGLWVTGMSVCATFGGPRMGPIFGGMLLSGRRVAEMVAEKLK